MSRSLDVAFLSLRPQSSTPTAASSDDSHRRLSINGHEANDDGEEEVENAMGGFGFLRAAWVWRKTMAVMMMKRMKKKKQLRLLLIRRWSAQKKLLCRWLFMRAAAIPYTDTPTNDADVDGDGDRDEGAK